MAKVYERIEPRLARWIGEQPVFFVGTAPLSGDGLVNISPKGLRGTFGVLDEHTFAYVDMTASGIETIAHLRENGRICVMFCSFDGTPNVVRLHGRGRVVTHGEQGFDEALAPFAMGLASRRTEARGVITVAVTRVADACGYAVPRMDLVEERGLLDAWAETRGSDRIATYHATRNATSIDGLPGLPSR